MNIDKYLSEIEHAVIKQMSGLTDQVNRVEELNREFSQLTASTEAGYGRAAFFYRNPELDDEGLGTFIYWDTYFGDDKQRYYKGIEANEAAKEYEGLKFSIAALSGNILQHAKQCISLRYGGIKKCPKGRHIGGVPIRDIIWAARNQAAHWEEGVFNSSTKNVFEKLAENIDPVFWEYRERSMALEIVRLLGWDNFEGFSADLSSLQGAE